MNSAKSADCVSDQNSLEGNLSDDTAILQKFQSEFLPGHAAVYFLIRIPIRSWFVISMSADSMYF